MKERGACRSDDLFVGPHNCKTTTFCDEANHETELDPLAGLQQSVAMLERTKVAELGARIAHARENKGLSQTALGKLIHQSQSAISFWEKGEREPGRDLVDKIARTLSVTARWLELGGADDGATDIRLTRIIGSVGADPSGRIVRTHSDDTGEAVPSPVGATSKCVAVRVDGHSMRGFADDGSLIFYENLETPPSEDLMGEKVVVQLAGAVDADDPDVLVKILRRGSKPGLYDLESVNGPTLKDVRIRWAAEIIQITPPRQARRLIRSGLA